MIYGPDRASEKYQRIEVVRDKIVVARDTQDETVGDYALGHCVPCVHG